MKKVRATIKFLTMACSSLANSKCRKTLRLLIRQSTQWRKHRPGRDSFLEGEEKKATTEFETKI